MKDVEVVRDLNENERQVTTSDRKYTFAEIGSFSAPARSCIID